MMRVHESKHEMGGWIVRIEPEGIAQHSERIFGPALCVYDVGHAIEIGRILRVLTKRLAIGIFGRLELLDLAKCVLQVKRVAKLAPTLRILRRQTNNGVELLD